MTVIRKRTYPDTPAGRARELKDADDAYLTRLGHRIKWTKGHGWRGLSSQSGYRGVCQHCRGIARVAWLVGDGGGNLRGYEGAMAKRFGTGVRRCTRGR